MVVGRSGDLDLKLNCICAFTALNRNSVSGIKQDLN
jgi:hypothetical protein